MTRIIDYFDLRAREPTEVKSRKTRRTGNWFPQYVALVLGVLVQPFLSTYQQTGQWNFGGAAGRLLFAVLVGIAIFPAVYKHAFDPEKPLFVQLCAIFAAGMGWESLFKTALKASGV
jgi:membrane protein YdbS with pleckstrin-like domain